MVGGVGVAGVADMNVMILAQFSWANPSTWLEALYKAVKEGLRTLWLELCEVVATYSESLMESIIAVLPAGLTTTVTDYGLDSYFRIANAWAPLDLGAGLIAAYYLFLSVFVTVKFILKIIPTVG